MKRSTRATLCAAVLLASGSAASASAPANVTWHGHAEASTQPTSRDAPSPSAAKTRRSGPRASVGPEVAVTVSSIDSVTTYDGGGVHITIPSGSTSGCKSSSTTSASQTTFRVPNGPATERTFRVALAAMLSQRSVTFKYDSAATGSSPLCNIVYLRIDG